MAAARTTVNHRIEFNHNFLTGPLEKIININGSQDCFDLTVKLIPGYSQNLNVTITPINRDTRFKTEFWVFCGNWYSCILDNLQQTKERLHCGHDMRQVGTVKVVINFDLGQPCLLQCPVVNDLKEFVDRGPCVTLVGADGSVTVPKRLLKIRAQALEAMFNHGTKESETMTIEMKDFNAKTLGAFGHFLMTGEMKDGIATAASLILLGDKYNLQPMKQAAENFALINFKELDQTEAVEVLAKVNVDVLKRALLKLSESMKG